MADRVVSSGSSGYRLSELGWLQFERVCSLLLSAETGRPELSWSGHADQGRTTVLDGSVELPTWGARLRGRTAVFVRWLGAGRSHERAMGRVALTVDASDSVDADTVLVLTNLEAAEVSVTVAGADRRVLVLGGRELDAAIDRHPSVRTALPSLLGWRDLSGLISPRQTAASSLQVEGAQALARVFWPTRAYARAREVVSEHRFVVLTGPPEMGKTAIARMLALAQLTDGWEAHECTSPDQLWRVFAAGRRQVFVADDAFGSTEYRPDAAERWARSLGRLLPLLDRDHWLVWTSRPAPLKAGLRRVQRERHAERFPAPGQVLVDASDLDLAEKTLILFRHAKARGLSDAARVLVRSSALTLVEHPHFTPERIRRLVSDRLDALQRSAAHGGVMLASIQLERELSTPTDAMRTSYRALEPEHRELLCALLDAPAGLIDERELTVTVRRHRPAGFSRPPGELIDRLTDHFLRVTPLGIGWVHPSWRDLVIDELRDDPAARRRFLAACSLYGMMLALSLEGGSAGERGLPLLVDDRDWDVLADRLDAFAGEAEDQQLAQLLLALRGLRHGDMTTAQDAEARSLATFVLARIARRWDHDQRIVPSGLVEHWYDLRRWSGQTVQPPELARTWIELSPGAGPVVDEPDLQRLDEWLALVQTLIAHDPERLSAFGFFEHAQALFARLIADLELHRGEIEATAVLESVFRRIRDLATSAVSVAAQDALETTERIGAEDRRWWVPRDIDAPPSDERVSETPDAFTRADVDRVLADL